MLKKSFVWGVCLSFLSGLGALAQVEAHVVTEDSPLRVVLVWSPDDTAVGYNIYRKSANAILWPRSPQNPSPVIFSTACEDILQLMPKGSDAWHLVANALATNDELFNPCELGTASLSEAQEAALSMLARANWQIASVLGFGFEDDSVINGKSYVYEIRGVDETGVETAVLATGLTITAGAPNDLPAATGLAAESGDHRVLLTWDEVEGATGYMVYRRTLGWLNWKRVNPTPGMMRMTTDLKNQPIDTVGFLDTIAWQENGDPGAKEVDGEWIVGPYNKVGYEYRIAAVDLMGYESTILSNIVTAKPLDATPPLTPANVVVSAQENAPPNGGLEIRWTHVTRDVDGHPENTNYFEVSRYEETDGVGIVVALVPAPAVGVNLVSTVDTDAQLRSGFGPKTWFYRVRTVDDEGNFSAYSAAANGFLKDIQPPAPPKSLTSEGFESFIRVSWDLGQEPDLDGYQLYRALCDDGIWDGEDRSSAPWVLIGEISFDEAEILAAHEGQVFMDDTDIPEGSPLCYAYLVKAKDTSQNISGSWPPDLNIEDYVCQNLRDRTGPDPAVITALDARDTSVYVSWAAPPIQDVKAYHVYRSQQPDVGYVWVGGRMVTAPAEAPIYLETPFTGNFSGCEDIPESSEPYMGRGDLFDKTVEPKQIYHYKVLGVDVHGNESKLDEAVAVSTFTYSSDLPELPQITQITQDPTDGSLTLAWTPHFDAATHLGFTVFREEVGGQGYFPVSAMVDTNNFVDTRVVAGKAYNYRIMLLSADGKNSAPSLPVNHLVSE